MTPWMITNSGATMTGTLRHIASILKEGLPFKFEEQIKPMTVLTMSWMISLTDYTMSFEMRKITKLTQEFRDFKVKKSSLTSWKAKCLFKFNY